ncbi:ABC transporter permease [Clostridium sp.]|uniref:ABC transporter permease n=1 Tax=Clostridium sp. TaxID=1506 RepID=UPI003F3E49F2
MRLNPVLRNESKLAVRTAKFTMLLFAYIAILTVGTLIFYSSYSDSVYTNGLDTQGSIYLYIGMAIAQAVLLMFIVPALTSTAICSEREKQTLDILLSSKLTPLQIIIGKVLASSAKVILLVICTMPMYAICSLIGGVKLFNIFELMVFFFVTTIFVSSIGVCVSTYMKTSKVATASTYGLVLFIFVGTLIIAWVSFMLTAFKSQGSVIPSVSPVIYLSPATGFISLLMNQVGLIGDIGYLKAQVGISNYAEYISLAVQLILSFGFIYLAALKLNPLNTTNKIKFLKRNKKIKE